MNLTPTGFIIIVGLLCCLAIIVVTAEILYDRNEPAPTPEPEYPWPMRLRDVCDLESCDRPATVIYDAHPSGGVLYICERHAVVVREWVGRSLAAPFDQEAS